MFRKQHPDERIVYLCSSLYSSLAVGWHQTEFNDWDFSMTAGQSYVHKKQAYLGMEIYPIAHFKSY